LQPNRLIVTFDNHAVVIAVALSHGAIPDPPIHALWTGSPHIVPKARPNGRPKTKAIKLFKFLRKLENT